MAKCPWSGRAFEAVKRGPNAKVFADDSARAEAHKAARLFTEQLIAEGKLTWDVVRQWYRRHHPGPGPAPISSYTTPAVATEPSRSPEARDQPQTPQAG